MRYVRDFPFAAVVLPVTRNLGKWAPCAEGREIGSGPAVRAWARFTRVNVMWP